MIKYILSIGLLFVGILIGGIFTTNVTAQPVTPCYPTVTTYRPIPTNNVARVIPTTMQRQSSEMPATGRIAPKPTLGSYIP